MGVLSRLISFLLIVLLSVLFIVISLLSFLFQKGPIIFSQVRIGYKYNKFKIHKFRTMKNLKNYGEITIKYDERVTKFGRFLRSTKIDEIPQLFNILKGDMRFVGPRPEIEKYFNPNDFYYLHSIKPGITDFSSILFRNESNFILNENSYDELLKLKNQLASIYLYKKSFTLDLYLVYLTIISLFFYKRSQLIVLNYIKKIDVDLYIKLDDVLNH